jgi:GSCFA family.
MRGFILLGTIITPRFFKIFSNFSGLLKILRNGRPFKTILTVSPVPLTATASGQHVLASTVYSKSVLRAVAGQLYAGQEEIDYFPSFEIVTNPRLHSTAFSENLRSVREETVESVMKHFFAEHPPLSTLASTSDETGANLSGFQEGVQCEEEILETFGK